MRLVALKLVQKKNQNELAKEINSSPMAGARYTTVIFNKGDPALTKISRKQLNQLLNHVHNNERPVQEIKILAWADKEYPESIQNKPSTKDVTLASERAFRIRDYLENHLKELEDIESYNMAKRPSAVSKILKDNDFSVKEAFQKSGATSSTLPDGTVSYTKASKALIIIQYKE